MNNEVIRSHYHAFVRIQAFGLKYVTSFPASGRAGQVFASFGTLVSQMEALGVGQWTGSKSFHSGTASKRQLAEEIRKDMRKLCVTARSIAIADRKPAFAEPFEAPKSRAFVALVTYARGALAVARPLAARFTESELPVDFLDELELKLEQVEDAGDSQEAGRSTQVGGTAGLAGLVDQGMERRRELDPLVHNRFENDPGTLAEWESASRIVRTKRGREEAAPVPAEQNA